MKVRHLVGSALLLAFLVALAWWNVSELREAFGPGPPHYGRSTNMDKWVNPAPVLLTVDLAVIAVVTLIVRSVRRGRRPPRL